MTTDAKTTEKKTDMPQSDGTGKVKKSKFADMICEITGWPREQALESLRCADRLGIKRSTFFNVKGYEWTQEELDALGYELDQKRLRVDDRIEDALDVIMEDMDCSAEEAESLLARRKDYHIKRSWYVENACYKMTDEELADFAASLETRRRLVEAASQPDVLSADDPRIKGLYESAPPSRRKKIADHIEFFMGEAGSAEADRIAREMDFLNVHYGFFFKEYFLFGLKDKTREEREAFMPNAVRKKYLRRLSTPRGFIICRNKALSYTHLKDLYKREIAYISSADDREKVKDFAGRYDVFVIKPLDSSFGHGIRKIETGMYADSDALADELIADAPFLLEELIVADERIAALHPASINTIRVTTYMDDAGSVTVHLPFFKIGQKGTFVDNGGSGGLFALIDADTGIVISDGKDESNRVYLTHPDTGVKLRGFQVPKWQELLEFAAAAAHAFPDVRYAGWDMALSADRGWQVVEVNCRTQFYGQQMCDEVGKRRDFEKLINWDSLKETADEFEEIWETIDRY